MAVVAVVAEGWGWGEEEEKGEMGRRRGSEETAEAVEKGVHGGR